MSQNFRGTDFVPAIKDGIPLLPAKSGIDSASTQLEWLWANCKIVYWPPDDRYCIEHNARVGKIGREMIEKEMLNAQSDSR